MAGNVRFEANMTSPEELGFSGNRSNGQKTGHPIVSLDRSGSFREGSDSRGFGSGASTPRSTGSSFMDIPSITHFLLLDPITMGDQEFTRSGELRQALGISLGNASEDNSFGASHSKPHPLVVTEELKKFRSNIIDGICKARVRGKRCDDGLLKIEKFFEFRKRHRNEVAANERPNGSNVLKMGAQHHRNSSDIGTQRLEDRTKNVVLNKRVRTSVAELRAESRSNALPRQHLVMGKDREVVKDGGEGYDMTEEKVRRLPAGGEGWEKKMKRKRSVGTVYFRPADSEGEAKRTIHHKFSNDSGLQSQDTQGIRSGSFNGTITTNKLDISSPASANAVPKDECKKVSLMRDVTSGMNKQRLLAKANKLTALEDNHVVNTSPVIKGKASRTPRSGSVMTSNSSPNFPRVSGSLEVLEQPPINAAGGPNNRKRPLSIGSSSPSMTQWVGQRPQKISRTRRANVVSPVSNHDEVQTSSETARSSDLAARVTSVGGGINSMLLAKDVANGNQNIKVKKENFPSPARPSESEESGAGESHDISLKDRETGTGVVERSPNRTFGPSALLMKKSKMLSKEDVGDGVRRQGRTGRVGSSRASASPGGDRLENPTSIKPLRMRTVSEKSGSKSGRPPLKKISERKGLSRYGQVAAGSSPDFTGESDDDHEELLAAANLSCNANYLSSSGSFWKKMEPVFASVRDSSYLEEELKSSQKLHENLSAMLGHHQNNLSNLLPEQDYQSLLPSDKSKRTLDTQDQLKVLVDRGQDDDASGGSRGRRNDSIPLYQRVLSALIVEDESEEFNEHGVEENTSFYHDRDNSLGDNWHSSEFEPRKINGIKFGYDPILGVQSQNQYSVAGFPCNGSASLPMATAFHSELCNDEFQGGYGSTDSMFSVNSRSNGSIPAMHENAADVSAMDGQYEQFSLEDKLLIELQSVGIYPEIVPDLTDGEDEAISQDLIKLQNELQFQVGKKISHLSKIAKKIKDGKEMEERAIENLAMDRLVESAYKKLLATKGSTASKLGIPKVSRPFAMAFVKRTLGRCRKFEESGKSCFSEPPLRDIILSIPFHGNDAEPCGAGSVTGRPDRHDLHNDTHWSDQDVAKTGPILNRGKKKELLLDDVGNNASYKLLSDTVLGGAKGKRSERERDKDASGRNSATKAGRMGQNNVKGDRKAKSKPKQKTSQLPTSGDGTINKFKESNNKKRELGLTSHGHEPQDSSKESREAADIADLPELELGIDNDFGGHQDLNSFLNFDDDTLPDNDPAGELPMEGLEIPMDDIFDVFR